MQSHVEFKSDKFPAYEGEEDEVNPGIWGKRLAEYLEQHLPSHGLLVRGILPEDWGWVVQLEHEPFNLWLGCACYGDDGYLCFIEPSKPFVRRWFRKIETRPGVEPVARALDAILRADPEIRSVRWWTPEEVGGFA